MNKGWMSPAIPILTSNSTLLSHGALSLSNEQISWVGSINYLGGFVGSLSFGYLKTLFGSKRITLFLAIPFICVWLIIYFGNHYYCLLIARLVFYFRSFIEYLLFIRIFTWISFFLILQQRLEVGPVVAF